MSNESGRWTAEEIEQHIEYLKKHSEIHGYIFRDFLSKVFYSADKAVLKEDIEVCFEEMEEYTKFNLKPLAKRMREFLSMLKSEKVKK
jgi:hypothetical protein